MMVSFFSLNGFANDDMGLEKKGKHWRRKPRFGVAATAVGPFMESAQVQQQPGQTAEKTVAVAGFGIVAHTLLPGTRLHRIRRGIILFGLDRFGGET
jgi:hypothetical protein